MPTAEGSQRRRWRTGVAAAALIAVGVVVGLVAAGGDDDGGDDVVATDDGPTTTSAPSSTTSTAVDRTTTSTADAQGPVAATADGEELLTLLEQGESASYTAHYRTNDPSNGLGPVEVDVWRDGDRARQDALVTVEGREVLTSAFIDGDRVRACQRGTLQPEWQCQDVSRDQVPDVDSRVRNAVAGLADRIGAGRDATIAGQAARCYDVTEGEGEPVELCVTTTGVPARFISGESTVELGSYAAGVPDGIFDPPA